MSGGMGGGEGGVSEDLLTTKGDTHGFSTLNSRVPIGADLAVLTADSTAANTTLDVVGHMVQAGQ